MYVHRRHIPSLIILACVFLSACTPAPSSTASSEARETLYQVSTIGSLMAGNYDGIKTVKQVKARGDLGIGTIDRLDGEMLLLDGTVYQVKFDGSVNRPGDDVTIPFSAVTFFDTDTSQKLENIKSLDDLKAVLDPMIVKKDRFYAFRIDGLFNSIQTRSVPAQDKPYPILSEVTKKQAVFNFENVKGSIIGFWCPDYVGSVNVPGYHLHFISEDRTRGGHLLNVNVGTAEVKMDETRFFDMELPEEAQQDAGFSDAQKEIDKVEK